MVPPGSQTPNFSPAWVSDFSLCPACISHSPPQPCPDTDSQPPGLRGRNRCYFCRAVWAVCTAPRAKSVPTAESALSICTGFSPQGSVPNMGSNSGPPDQQSQLPLTDPARDPPRLGFEAEKRAAYSHAASDVVSSETSSGADADPLRRVSENARTLRTYPGVGARGGAAGPAHLVVEHPADVLQVVVVQEQIWVQPDPAAQLPHADHTDVRADVTEKRSGRVTNGHVPRPARWGHASAGCRVRPRHGLGDATRGSTQGTEANPYR